MGRFLPLLFLSACSAPPPSEEPAIHWVPATLIAKNGASLYVFEAPEGWGSDGLKPERPWVKTDDLKTLLKHGLSQKSVLLIGQADFLVTAGRPVEATLFIPAANPRTGFRVALRASWSTPYTISVDWKAERLTESPTPKGTVSREVRGIGEGSQEMPRGSSVIVRDPATEGREYLVLVRVASLDQP